MTGRIVSSPFAEADESSSSSSSSSVEPMDGAPLYSRVAGRDAPNVGTSCIAGGGQKRWGLHNGEHAMASPTIIITWHRRVDLRDPQEAARATCVVIVKVARPMKACVAPHALRAWRCVHHATFAACNADAAYCTRVGVMGAGIGVRHLKGSDSEDRGDGGWGTIRGR
jgi:hypothetical protein